MFDWVDLEGGLTVDGAIGWMDLKIAVDAAKSDYKGTPA